MLHLWLLGEVELLNFLIFLLLLQLRLLLLRDIVSLGPLHRHGVSNVRCEVSQSVSTSDVLSSY